MFIQKKKKKPSWQILVRTARFGAFLTCPGPILCFPEAWWPLNITTHIDGEDWQLHERAE